MKNLNVKERIRLFARKTNLTNYAIEKSMDMSKGVLGNSCKLNADAVSSFLKAFPNANAEWIMTGNGEMLNIEYCDHEDLVSVYGEEKARQLIISQNDNKGNVNNGKMVEPTMEVGETQYSELIKEKDERIADLKDMVNCLKEQLKQYQKYG